MEKLLLLTALTAFLQTTCTAPPVRNTLNPRKDILGLLQKANAGLRDMLHQGDIRKKTRSELQPVAGGVLSNADPCASATCKWPKDTNGFVSIPVLFDPAFDLTRKNLIMNALQVFKTKTCVQFVHYKNLDLNYLHIVYQEGCWSHVGFQGGVQELSLGSEYCLTESVIQHEFLHALGFEHEHSRSDRDQNIRIQWTNVIPGAEPNFEKVDTDNLQTDYDFTSILQYGPTAFSVNRNPTIEPLNSNITTFGDAPSMSQSDIQRVNRLYKC